MNIHSAPVVALNRVQSGVGTLSISMLGAQVPLGCVFEADDMGASMAETLGSADAHVALGTQGQVLINLRRIATLRRFLVFGATSPQTAQSGAIRVTTFSGATMEREVRVPTSQGSFSMLSGHVVDGMLIVRQEPESEVASVRQTCENYGYALAWISSDTPSPPLRVRP